MTPRELVRELTALGLSLLAAMLGWVALWSWSPLVEAPHRFLVPAFVCALLIAFVGTAGRAIRLSPYVVVLAQLVVSVLYLEGHFTGGAGGALPSLRSFSSFLGMIRDGAVDVNTYTSPVSQRLADVFPFLALAGVALMLSIDLLARGLRRVPVAGLPVLLAVTIPISVLTDRLPLAVFGLCAVLFLALLTAEEVRRIRGWGRPVTAPNEARAAVMIPVAATQVGVLTMLGALLLPLFIPVGAGILRPGTGDGPGNGHEGVAIVNPLIDLRRDLVRKTHTPLVYVDTSDPDPSYLRITVLDDFTGAEWRPSQRHLPQRNRVNGPMPEAPGLAAGITGDSYDWTLQLGSTFETTWLPTPYPATSVRVGGDWRYDDRTLDIVDFRRSLSSKGLRYTARSFDPALDDTVLNAVASPPGAIAGPETQLPSQLPAVITQTAKRVTAGAKTQYRKAIALQDWFRNSGGFTYSTAQAPGSGMDLIARFITTDKVGYCEQFAASYAVMARALNIPARVVVGFLHPKKQGQGSYLYTTDELHAWPELYFSGVGWVRFEPTPADRTGAAPAYTRHQVGRPDPAASASRSTAPANSPRAVPVDPSSKSSTSNGSGAVGWLEVLAVLVVLTLLALTPRLLRRRRRHAWLAVDQDTRALAYGAWAELRATAIDHGIGWPDHRSPRETAARLRARVTADVALVRDLDAFVSFVERVRYGRPFEADDETRAMVRRTVASWSEAMSRASSQRAANFAAWLPRSVFERTSAPDPVSSDPEVGVRV